MGYILQQLHQLVWGIPALVSILGVGGYLSLRTGFAQLRLLPNGLRLFVQRMGQKDTESKDITPYQAFCTALGATVGTGNIAGVAGAIAIGGPGAVFWMWISALFGMVTKYAEALLAVRYQVTYQDNKTMAGPMYVLARGMGSRWKGLAYLYAFLGVAASFGVGNSVQVNAVVFSIQRVASSFGEKIDGTWIAILGIGAAILVYILLLGGAKRIARIAENLVPIVSFGYILLCAGALLARWQRIDDALGLILKGAFSPEAATGGVVGSMLQPLRVGTSRGVFTNEAGLGTAGIAHGCAKVKHPAMQGVLGIVEVFIDTIVICTLTALVILCSGVTIEYGSDLGAELTFSSFAMILGERVAVPLAIIMLCLAVATILGWGLYGTCCAEFLFGKQSYKAFALLQGLAAFFGAVMQTPAVWLWAETLNGLMLFPSLIAIVHRSESVVRLTSEYRKQVKLERKHRRLQSTVLWKRNSHRFCRRS